MRSLQQVQMIAAPTARSKAYLQTLLDSGLKPAKLWLMGEEKATRVCSNAKAERWKDILLPDLSLSLARNCEQENIPHETLPVENINDPLVVGTLQQAAPELLIYSGFGGQIVADAVLRTCSQVVHVHSGWLPDYRGSTTLYYALLNEESPGVTALLLDSGIDTGPVLQRAYYPKPDARMDVDERYDAAIRADLLCRVIRYYAARHQLPKADAQWDKSGKTYYVVHPVLKHLALLSLREDS